MGRLRGAVRRRYVPRPPAGPSRNRRPWRYRGRAGSSHALLQRKEAAPYPALDRAERNFEPSRQFAVTHAVHIGQHHDVAAGAVDLLEAAAQRAGLRHPRQGRLAVDILDAVIRCFIAVLIAMYAECAVAHHRIEPAARAAAARIEPGRTTPDPDKGVVHRLFREILPEQNAAGDADHARRLAVVDHAQSSTVARRA